MKLIFVIEDEEVIRSGVRTYLELSGFTVLTFANLKNAEEAINKSKPDLLIQDVMLPDGDGFDFVEKIKKKFDIPVVFMTAKISEEDRIKGFELGADDYIIKPFSPKELVLRIQAIFRRIDNTNGKDSKEFTLNAETTYKLGDSRLKLDKSGRKVLLNGKRLNLTLAEQKVLDILIRKQAVVSRAEILKECFDYTSDSYSRIVDTHIKNLRAKLGDSEWIETNRGTGYRFTGIIDKK